MQQKLEEAFSADKELAALIDWDNLADQDLDILFNIIPPCHTRFKLARIAVSRKK